MNVFSVHPLCGVNDIKFGDQPSAVRKKLGRACESFKRSEESAYPCDFFETIGVFAYYDADGCLEALEFVLPASVVLDGVDLLKIPASQVRDILLDKDQNLEVEIDGVTSYKVGVGMYSPDLMDAPSTFPESVIVFAQDYYT